MSEPIKNRYEFVVLFDGFLQQGGGESYLRFVVEHF